MSVRTVLMLGVALALVTPVHAQQVAAADTAGPMAVVRELFDAMRAGDSTRARKLFHPSMTHMVTSDRGQDGQLRVNSAPVDAFMKAVGMPRTEVFDERIANPRVQVEGGLATVWVDYGFFRGAQFSHCGVDAVHLVRDAAGWRIAALADTRRQSGCEAWRK
jgi:hypothetical protein